MRHSENRDILERILALTKKNRLRWKHDVDTDWFDAQVGESKIAFRFLRYEATNQIGADPMAFQFIMRGFSEVYFFGTEGASIIFEILEAGLDWTCTSYEKAVEFLDENFPDNDTF